jgi:hypothetical protein
MEEDGAVAPLTGMSLYLTRKLRAALAPFASPVISNYNVSWNDSHNAMFHYFVVESATVYTASELLNGEFDS